MKKTLRRIRWTLLDIIGMPGLFMSNEGNSNLHLKYICPRCPTERRKLREIVSGRGCYWNNEWSRGNYDIPRSFGFVNWFSQYFFGETNLEKYKVKD